MLHAIRLLSRPLLFVLAVAASLPAQAVEPQLAAGGDHNCLLDATGVHCWGDNSLQQNKVPLLADPESVATGGKYACAIDGGALKCWGDIAASSLPVVENAQLLALGPDNGCVLDDNGTTCWGKNNSQLSSVPASVINPSRLTIGASHACALDASGVECWGKPKGQDDFNQEVVPAMTSPTEVVAGHFHTCALHAGGVTCWGKNTDGQASVPPMINPFALAAGASHTCAIDDGGVQCWGDNSFGQTIVPPLTTPVAIAAGANHTCALDDSGVVCWGDESAGQLDAPTLSALVFSGQLAKDYLGTAVAYAGDVDNDGVGDVLVGSPRYDALVPTTTMKIADAGRAVVISGATGAELFALYGSKAKDYFGSSVAGVGDIDNDGHDDIAVGASKADTATLVDAGCVYVFSGAYTAGDDPLMTVCGERAKQQFGNAIAAADVDGDSVPDLILGSYLDDRYDTVSGKLLLKDAGSVTVLSGADRSAPYTQLMKIYGDSAGDWAGFAVAAGLVDGDSLLDVIVGAPKDDVVLPAVATLKDAGSVKAYAATYSDGDPALFSVHGDSAGDWAGYAVAAADVDGDGRDEVVVGVPRDDYVDEASGITLKESGSVRVFEETGVERLASKATGVPQAKGFLGWSVAVTGNVDNDGNDDVIAGAWQYDVPNPAITGKLLKNAGRLYAFGGGTGAVLLAVDGDGAADAFGAAVAAGDVTQDGVTDFIVAAPRDDRVTLSATGKAVLVKDVGRVTVYSGKSALP